MKDVSDNSVILFVFGLAQRSKEKKERKKEELQAYETEMGTSQQGAV